MSLVKRIYRLTRHVEHARVSEVKSVFQVSESLANKVIEGTISLSRAKESAEMMRDVADKTPLTEKQEATFVKRIEEEQKLIGDFQEAVLQKVKKVLSTPPSERKARTAPIGRVNPVTYIVKVKDEIKAKFRRHISNCDMGERGWALRVLTEIQEEIDYLVKLLSEQVELKPRKENECPFCRGEFTHLSTKATGVYPEKMYECENCGKVTHHSNDNKALEGTETILPRVRGSKSSESGQ